jgi:hypothetical protein
VVVTRTGFFPVERDVVSEPGLTRTVRVTLEPTEEIRVAHVDKASGQRRRAWITIALGVVAGGASTYFFLRNEDERRAAQAEVAEVKRKYEDGGECFKRIQANDMCGTWVTHANDRVDRGELVRVATLIGAGAGAALLLTGAILRATAEDPHRYDFEPIKEPRLGLQLLAGVSPGGAFAGLRGRF